MILKPKNWDKFQHYKDRNPPWIKVHKEQLDDPDFMSLSLASIGLAQLLWLLASESKDGTFDASMKILTFRLRKTEAELKKLITPLIHSGFFDVLANDSAVLADDTESCSEGETEGETEGEKKHAHGEHGQVKLTADEFNKIDEYTGGRRTEYIDTLDRYLAQNNKKYKSHYAVLQNFYRRDVESGKVKERPKIADINKFL